jgi:hypothetical protein
MKGRKKMMKRLFAGDKPVTIKKYTGTMKTRNISESAMKKAIVVALALFVLPLTAQAEEKATPSPHAAAPGTAASNTEQILPPDILVRNVLLPAWRTSFRSEVKSWHNKGAAILEKVSVTEDESEKTFAEAACAADCTEKERAAPPLQNRPFGSADL